MRWWGWGDREHVDGLTPGALAMLRERVGISTDPHPPVTLASVELAPSRLGRVTLPACGPCSVRQRADGAARTAPAQRRQGLSGSPAARAGRPAAAPDAVVYPRDRERLAALLDHCVERSIAVVPFGGGTSVVGGVSPQARAHRAVLSTRHRGARPRARPGPHRPDRPRPGRDPRGEPRAPARRGGLHARPLSTVLRVRLDRRLHCHALGRPGIDRLRLDRGDDRWRDARRARGRRSPRSPSRTPPPARICVD